MAYFYRTFYALCRCGPECEIRFCFHWKINSSFKLNIKFENSMWERISHCTIIIIFCKWPNNRWHSWSCIEGGLLATRHTIPLWSFLDATLLRKSIVSLLLTKWWACSNSSTICPGHLMKLGTASGLDSACFKSWFKLADSFARQVLSFRFTCQENCQLQGN